MIIQLNHNDLDAMGCHFVLRQKYEDILQLNTSYANIETQLDIIHDKLSYDKTVSEVFITDLSFNQEQYTALLRIVSEFSNINFTFIDHHPVQFNVSANPKNMYCILSTEFSATKLTAQYLDIDNDFINAVDAFDTWKKGSKYFKYGFMLNTLYWDYKQKRFTYNFKSMQKPSESHLNDYKDLKDKKDKHFANLRSKGLLLNDNKVLISFTDKHLNWIQIDYPNEEFYINATSYGTINIRIGDVVPEREAGELKDILSKTLTQEDWFVDIGGHPRAFGIAHHGENNHLIIVECVKHIFEEIKKIKEAKDTLCF